MIRGHLLCSVALAAALLTQAGCVTSKKYRLAKDDTPPAQALGWTAATPAATLTLESLVVFKGPGSWKREARWDEYIVRVTNTGNQPLAIYDAELEDLQGGPQHPGDDPWALEKLSYTNWDKYGKVGLKLAAGAGAVVVYGAAVTGVALSGMAAGSAASGAVFLVADVIPLVALVDVTTVAVMNHNNRNKVEAEFARRKLNLPLMVSPGASAQGSLFFPMTPGPRRLTLRRYAGEARLEVTLELKPLAGLHLAPKPAKK